VALHEKQEKDSRVNNKMLQVHIEKLCTEFINKGDCTHKRNLKHQVLTEKKLDETNDRHKPTPQKSSRHLKQETSTSKPSAQTVTKLLNLQQVQQQQPVNCNYLCLLRVNNCQAT
jgi:hypothetical protein